MIFCSSRTRRFTRRIRGRAVKALRSGRSQLCWRGFESHRMQHLFAFFCGPPRLVFAGLARFDDLHQGQGGSAVVRTNLLVTYQPASKAHKGSLWRSRSRPTQQKKGYGGTGIRARVKRITTAYANHYTIPPRWNLQVLEDIKMGGPQGE